MNNVIKFGKNKSKYFVLFVLAFSFISSDSLSPLNPIVYKTKLWVEDTFIFTGIKISEDEGLSSYGSHSIGLLNSEKDGLTTQELDNNYFDYHLKINKDYLDGKLELSDNSDIQLSYYDRNTGFTVRLIPFLIHQTNIFGIQPSTYVENFYFVLTSIIFAYLLKKIWETEGIITSLLFGLSHFLYWIFIIHTRAFATPYIISIIPFIIPFTGLSKYLYKKNVNFYFLTFVLLIPFLEHITVGYVQLIALLTGIFLKNNFSFLINYIKNNFFKLGFSLFFSLLISQIVVVLQNYFFLNQSLSYTLESHWYHLTKRESGVGIWNCFGDGTYFDAFNMYINSKIINLQIFELNYLYLTIISLGILIISTLVNKVSKSTKETFYIYLISLFSTITWFMITKSHSLCHPHFQPMLYLYSTFPLIVIFYGRLIRDLFKNKINS
tara:strand:- start:2300 stop:3610 length:1311 start_codon:yes stop_codon:yes gene_type:complete